MESALRRVDFQMQIPYLLIWYMESLSSWSKSEAMKVKQPVSGDGFLAS